VGFGPKALVAAWVPDRAVRSDRKGEAPPVRAVLSAVVVGEADTRQARGRVRAQAEEPTREGPEDRSPRPVGRWDRPRAGATVPCPRPASR